MARKPRSVREPIQVYLTRGERARLDRLARSLGVSRAEVLRRGLEALAGGRATGYDPMDALVGALDAPGTPTDLAARHDDALADATEHAWHDSTQRSS